MDESIYLQVSTNPEDPATRAQKDRAQRISNKLDVTVQLNNGNYGSFLFNPKTEFVAHEPVVGRLSCKEQNVRSSKILYLACPYMHNDRLVMKFRYDKVTKAAANLAKAGYIVFSPITHAYPMHAEADFNIPGNWDFWKELDLPILKISGLLVVLMLEGWEISIGVQAEIDAAQLYHIPILYVKPEEIHEIHSIVAGWDYLDNFRIKGEENALPHQG